MNCGAVGSKNYLDLFNEEAGMGFGVDSYFNSAH